MMIEKLDRSRHDFDRVMEVLAVSVGEPTARVAKWSQEFYGASGRELYVTLREGIGIGVIGIGHTGRSHAIIEHLAVHPQFQRQGVGRCLIDAVVTLLGLKEVVAETDSDAEGFYRACGFTVSSLGEKYPDTRPGVERFQCIKKFDEEAD